MSRRRLYIGSVPAAHTDRTEEPTAKIIYTIVPFLPEDSPDGIAGQAAVRETGQVVTFEETEVTVTPGSDSIVWLWPSEALYPKTLYRISYDIDQDRKGYKEIAMPDADVQLGALPAANSPGNPAAAPGLSRQQVLDILSEAGEQISGALDDYFGSDDWAGGAEPEPEWRQYTAWSDTDIDGDDSALQTLLQSDAANTALGATIPLADYPGELNEAYIVLAREADAGNPDALYLFPEAGGGFAFNVRPQYTADPPTISINGRDMLVMVANTPRFTIFGGNQIIHWSNPLSIAKETQ